MSKCRDLDPLFAPYADGEVAADDRAPPRRTLSGARRAARASKKARRLRYAGRPTRGASHVRVSSSRAARHSAVDAPAVRPGRQGARRRVPLSLAATSSSCLPARLGSAQRQGRGAGCDLDHVTCFQFARALAHTDSATACANGQRGRAGRFRFPRAPPAPASSSRRAPLLEQQRPDRAHDAMAREPLSAAAADSAPWPTAGFSPQGNRREVKARSGRLTEGTAPT